MGDAAARSAPNGPPEKTVKDIPFHTDAAHTTLIIDGTVTVEVTCTSAAGGSGNNCQPDDIGAFVDGVGVSGTKSGLSGFSLPPNFFTDFPVAISANGAIADIPPGDHHLMFGYTDSSAGDGQLTVTYTGGTAQVLNVAQ
jgi:hypothetical protein